MNVIPVNTSDMSIRFVGVDPARVFESAEQTVARHRGGDTGPAPQRLDPATGLPLWNVSVTAISGGELRKIAEREQIPGFTGRIQVPSELPPSFSFDDRLEFVGLVASLRANGNQSVATFSARGVHLHGRPQPPRPSTPNGSKSEPAPAPA